MSAEKNVTIVGCGPGGADHVTPAAERAARDAEVVVGARRLLDLFGELAGETLEVTAPLEDVLDRVADLAEEGVRVAVLVSGDPGLHSLARLVVRRVGRERCRIIPGVSSVQAAFAAVGLSWEKARIESAHHALPEVDLAELAAEEKIAVLMGSEEARDWAARLAREASGHRSFVCENLTLPGESVRGVSAAELAQERLCGPAVVLFVKEELLR